MNCEVWFQALVLLSFGRPSSGWGGAQSSSNGLVPKGRSEGNRIAANDRGRPSVGLFPSLCRPMLIGGRT